MNELDTRDLLKHLLKTIQYRMSKVLDVSSVEFGAFDIGNDVRTPEEILSHVSDVLNFCVVAFEPEHSVESSPGWTNQVERYRNVRASLNRVLKTSELSKDTALRLVQCLLSDVLTHIGQLAMLCRMLGQPIEGENFFIVELPDIVEGFA